MPRPTSTSVRVAGQLLEHHPRCTDASNATQRTVKEVFDAGRLYYASFAVLLIRGGGLYPKPTRKALFNVSINANVFVCTFKPVFGHVASPPVLLQILPLQ